MRLAIGSTRLCLISEADDGAGERLDAALRSAALAGAPAASVLITPPPGRPLAAAEARRLVGLAQSNDAAALIWADVDLALAAEADGVHVPYSDEVLTAYRAARQALGPGRIVGASVGTLRHDAMVLGEEGADYVAFGRPDDMAGSEVAAEERLELVQWWAEIFQIPCVAIGVATADETQALAAAGADFIGIVLPKRDQAAVSAHVKEITCTLAGAVKH